MTLARSPSESPSPSPSTSTSPSQSEPPPRARGVERARAYGKLAKLSFFDYYLCVLVVASLSPGAVRSEPRSWLVLLLFDLGWVGVVAAAVTLDDVTGLRDGSDARNYDPRQTLRARDRKPLLDGRIPLPQALRFGWGCAVAGAALWALAAVAAPHTPWWVWTAAAGSLVISVQYSYGLKLSYRGGQEAVIWISTGLCVLIPFGLLNGGMTGAAWLECFLFGLWSLMVSVYSNINDVAGDREAGRRNLATSVPPGVYRWFIAVLSLAESGAIVLAAAVGAVPLWFCAFLLPVVCLRARQAYAGLLAGQELAARRQGITIHRWGVALLVVANLLLVHGN
ncbi:UbiA family prenyltransferase [Streptomyces sp. N2-109]|uniref:UbiA family prenyltransferase n=1 Tax=Streptomyces gossypii TaxID=2883101 RepID=A0ABT2JNY8_9ACTN|nr:UbiA family prenyltransferase [Streptomyces gossypii]MCT2589580.1 UbiA family prenyltransferase [Streptomyces gossypii]